MLYAIPFLLFFCAGTFLPSGLSSILNVTTPIWTAIITAVAVRSSRPTPDQVAGVIMLVQERKLSWRRARGSYTI